MDKNTTDPRCHHVRLWRPEVNIEDYHGYAYTENRRYITSYCLFTKKKKKKASTVNQSRTQRVKSWFLDKFWNPWNHSKDQLQSRETRRFQSSFARTLIRMLGGARCFFFRNRNICRWLYLKVSRIMVKRTNLPRSGTTSDVGGIISASRRKNTVSDSKIEIDRLTCN